MHTVVCNKPFLGFSKKQAGAPRMGFSRVHPSQSCKDRATYYARPAFHRFSTRRMVAAMLLIILGGPGAATAASLDNIDFASLPGGRVQLRLKLSQPPTQAPLSFTIDNPARIAIDLPNTQLKMREKSKTIGVGLARSVSAAEAAGRTRVVVNLAHMVPYDIKLQGTDILVSLNASAASKDDALPLPLGQAPTRGASIQNIDFRRGEHGQGQVIVALSDPAIGIDVREEGGKIIVDFADTWLPDTLDRKLDVTDFATPVTEIDTVRHGGGARMVISPTGTYEHVAYQAENQLTIEVRPLTKQEDEQLKKDKFGYTGERLSLNFQEIEVRAVLQLIADFTGLNLVAADTVTGTVTLRLKNVPWDQALDIILKSKGLGMRQAGNVIMVAPQEEIAAREKLELESQKQIEELAPLQTEFIPINYAKAADIAALLKAEENNLLSERGNVSVDERTNTLLLQDTADKLAQLRKVISTLDIPVRQVMIESRLVIANDDFAKEIGIQFAYSKNTTGTGGASSEELFSILGGKLEGTRPTEFGGGTAFVTGDQEDATENFIVSLPTLASPQAALGLAVGKIGSYLLQLELSALQEEGRGEIISSPRVITANQKEAVIEQGEEIPFNIATSSGATSVQFKKAVISLRVTPHITPDDRVILDLSVNKDARGQITPAGFAIDTNNITTQVLVDNGDTVVLGGIFEHTNRDNVRRVPFFGELPYVGWLFKATSNIDSKRELLIFVTPKILKETLRLG